MDKFINPPALSPKELRAHIERYASQCSLGRHLWNVHTDMPVFKWANYVGQHGRVLYCIVNLVIPKGAVIRVKEDALGWPGKSRKMRASQALVHSVVTLRGRQLKSAYSWYDWKTNYLPGGTVLPRRHFDTSDVECASGIHFYTELRDALRGAKS